MTSCRKLSARAILSLTAVFALSTDSLSDPGPGAFCLPVARYLRHVSGTLPDEVSAAFAENHRSGPVSQLVPFRTLDKLLLFVERADCDRCFGVAYWKQGQPNVKPFWFYQNFAYSTELDDAPTQPASWGIQLRFLGKPSEEIVIRLNIGPAIPHGDFSWREFFKKAELEVIERPIRRKNDCLNRRSSSEKAPVLDNEE